MVTQTAKSKLQDVQAPQPRRTMPKSQPLESQTDHQRDCPIAGQEPQAPSASNSVVAVASVGIAPSKPAPRLLNEPSAAAMPAVWTQGLGRCGVLPWDSMEPRADCRHGGGQP